jgi:predicted nucleic acid-binding protein
LRHERVVDASVVVKLFVDEEFSDKAKRLFRTGHLLAYVPDLLYIDWPAN